MELDDLLSKIYTSPSAPRKEIIRELTAEILRRFIVLWWADFKMSLINTGVKATVINMYKVEKNIETALYPKNGNEKAMPKELIAMPANIHW